MRITSRMVVGDDVKNTDGDVRKCPECGSMAVFSPQKVMVFSKRGIRTVRLWACDFHPLPKTITDEPWTSPPRFS